ncbi:DUF4180 domain-containing protein [Agromyces sp. Marseille-P2726]|uniref:DUF4180 domain-containing protein n=1 Tax=Agromyces sp. Marseille-P2726 TaxID=2709132 RepID=UPI00156E908F|nr:DUF4180 domain-containing protein [Agromyces sp. Marseille-P2726]
MQTDEHATRILHVPPHGPAIVTSDDTSDLIGSAWANRAELIAIPAARLDPAFFDLSSGVAGEMTQKFVNYRLRVAIVGDISAYVAESDALRDYVWESNRGTQVWFVSDEAALHDKLAGRPARMGTIG